METELDKLKRQLKSSGYLRRYLEQTGRRVGEGGQLSCPDTSAHSNGDKHPSAHLYEDTTGERVKCFGCDGSWDIFKLYQADKGVGFMQAVEGLAALFGLDFPKLGRGAAKPAAQPAAPAPDRAPVLEGSRSNAAQEYLKECAARLGETDYFERRGISQETARRLGCGFDPAHYFPSLHERRPGVVFPSSRGWAARCTQEKAHSFTKGITNGAAFNLEALKRAEPSQAVYIVEGQFDALSFEEIGRPAVALGGIQHVEEIVEAVRRRRLLGPVVVSLDNESNEQTARNVERARVKLEQGLREAGAFVYHLDAPIFSQHDANDALLADRTAFAAAVDRVTWLASEAYVLKDEGKDEGNVGKWAKRTRRYSDIPEPVPEGENPRALFKRGYLRKGGGLCLVSCAGVGKSVISLQLALAWSIGKSCLGLEPVRPLKIGVLTFEDDDEDNAAFRRDYRKGFEREGWTPEEIDRAFDAVEFIDLGGKTDEAFASALTEMQLENPRDLYIVNPLGDVMDEYDISDNAEAKHFLKRIVDPVVKGLNNPKTECGIMFVSHTGKAPKGAKEREGFMRGQFAQYDAQGAAALMNWTRAVLMIAPTETPGDFILIGAKRQNKLGWTDATGAKTNARYISYSPDIMFWVPTPEERVRKMLEDDKGKGAKPAVDPRQDAIAVAAALRSLPDGIPATDARHRAQSMLGTVRGNKAFDTIAKSPAAFSVPYSKTGKVQLYGGPPNLGLKTETVELPEVEPPEVEGVDEAFDDRRFDF